MNEATLKYGPIQGFASLSSGLRVCERDIGKALACAVGAEGDVNLCLSSALLWLGMRRNRSSSLVSESRSIY